MVRQRTPIKRKKIQRFTPEIVEAFTQLRNVYEKGVCSCPPFDWEKYWAKENHWLDGPDIVEDPNCKACQAYAKAENEVVGLLDLPPWQELENPYLTNPYPPGTRAWKEIEDRKKLKDDVHGGFALWRRLERASGLQPLRFDDDEAVPPTRHQIRALSGANPLKQRRRPSGGLNRLDYKATSRT